MIRAVIMMNNQGIPRLVKFYDYQTAERQQEIIRRMFGVLCRRPKHMSNFIPADSVFGPDARLVYKIYATLYVVFVFDASENELAILEILRAFVVTLDKCFTNVRELDILFCFNKVHTILDEMILGGQVLETSSSDVFEAVEEISRLEKTSNSVFPKSIFNWLVDSL